MADFYFSVNLSNNRTLHIAPLTDRIIAESGQEVRDAGGYFLFERRRDEPPGRVEIIAQMLSEEAALLMRDMLKMA